MESCGEVGFFGMTWLVVDHVMTTTGSDGVTGTKELVEGVGEVTDNRVTLLLVSTISVYLCILGWIT